MQTGTMARRPEDNPNWGGVRPNSGRKPVWIVADGTPAESLRMPLTLKQAIMDARDSGVTVEEMIEAIEKLTKTEK